ncbi:hypothetical protein ACFVIM_27010 [Streptomyces sp. NPDC057638]|uniref:hypothetical protein n=1 Tax=Streptomyces sp. NPDC057638 TaxID=3346190 RepID=UPI0036916C73
MPRTGRDHVHTDKTTIVARYCEGESIKALAAEYRVSDAWMKKQLTTWGLPVRGVRDARILRARAQDPVVTEQQPPTCGTCDGLVAAEREARHAHDHSAATDARVLLRRHQQHSPDHRPRTEC